MSWYIFHVPFSSFITMRQGLHWFLQTFLSSLVLYGCFVNGNMIVLPGTMLRKESYEGSILGAKFSEWPALPAASFGPGMICRVEFFDWDWGRVPGWSKWKGPLVYQTGKPGIIRPTHSSYNGRKGSTTNSTDVQLGAITSVRFPGLLLEIWHAQETSRRWIKMKVAGTCA